MRFSPRSLPLSLLVLAIALAVGLVCWLLLHDAPGSAAAPIARWLGRALQGDLGVSLATGRPVALELAMALRNTLLLALAAAMFGLVVGSVLGIRTAARQSRWPGKVASTLAASGMSLRHCWLGWVLVAVFSARLGWLPALGSAEPETWGMHFFLAAITLSVLPMGIAIHRIHGAAMQAPGQDTAVTRHIALQWLKKAAPAVLASMGMQLGFLIGGAMLVETVFFWPGMGQMLNAAISRRDVPVLQGMPLALGVMFALLHFWANAVRASVSRF